MLSLQVIRLPLIRKKIYTRRYPLEAEILKSGEPVPFEEMKAALSPVRAGETWGRKPACAWLHIRGAGPDGFRDPVVLLKNRGEGLVYNAEGVPLAALSDVYTPADYNGTPQSGGVFRVIDCLDLSEGVDFYVDCGYNGFKMYDRGQGRYGGAFLADRNREAYAYYYDYLVLLLLAGTLKAGRRKKELTSLLDASFRRFVKNGASAGREVLAPVFSGEPDSGFSFAAVGHGHLDLAWLWPVRETKRKAARTYAGILRGLEKHSGFIYGTSQPQQLWWLKEQHPGLYVQVKDAILSGRIEMQGAFWVECDTNLPCGESLIRQALYGSRFIREEFGLTARLCWLPDAFGFSAALPQIIRGCGMEYFSTIKLSWNRVNVFPYRTFWWEGIDGSRVLAHMPPEGNYNSDARPESFFRALKNYPEQKLGKALLVYGAGDGGGGPNETHFELLERQKKLPDLPLIRDQAAADFFDELKAAGPEAVYRGELYLEAHQGTYTTQGRNKYYNRLDERLLHNAEALAAAGLAGGLSPESFRPVLDKAWREVLLYQFHDIIPGSSITRVYRESLEGYLAVEKRLDELIDELIDKLLNESNPKASGRALLNLTSFEREEYFREGGRWFTAKIPPYAAVFVRPLEDPSSSLRFDGKSMSNGLVTLFFGKDGEIISCRVSGRELAGPGGLNRLTLFRDKFTRPFNAWDIDPDYRRRPKKNLRPYSSITETYGPRLIRTSRYRFGSSSLVQKIILERGRDIVVFETEVLWLETHKMLRAEFFPADYGDEVRCEIQFGHLARKTTESTSIEKAQFEVCAHHWAAVEKDGRGFALLNDSKYGLRAKNGLLSLNLLRAPVFPDREADRGNHRFSYAFCPFASGRLDKVIAEGYRLNNPVLPVSAPLESLVRVSGSAVIVETVKPAENGRGVVLRLYESIGKTAVVQLEISIPYTVVSAADLLENPTGTADLANLSFSPFEIKTLLVQ
jgi:alpha-mannosidase